MLLSTEGLIKKGNQAAASVGGILSLRAFILWWCHVLNAADLWELESNTYDNGSIIAAECCREFSLTQAELLLILPA